MTITKSQFVAAWHNRCDEAGVSYDPWDTNYAWNDFKRRPQDYADTIKRIKKDEESVEIPDDKSRD